MPELAEVEFMTRRLRDWLEGGAFRLEVLDPRLDPDGALLALAAQGDFPVTRVLRRAKYSLLQNDAHTLLLHYRMTGKVNRAPEPPKHTRARFYGDRETVNFIDLRRIGTLTPIPTPHLDDYFRRKKLGAELWPERRDGAWWRARFEGIRGPIKPALLRQDRVVGIGNILASETLWHARVSPDRPTNTLTLAEWSRLAEGLHTTVSAILSRETGDEIAYINDGATPESAGFHVYQRAGEPAPCCGRPISRRVDGGRGTFWCEGCQG